MTFEVLEQYLDGELGAEQRAAVERTVASDPRVAAMLAQAQSARAARVAALKGHEPSAADAQALAQQVLAACKAGDGFADSPVIGRVGNFSTLKRFAAAVAVIALIGAAYGLGRSNAPVQTVEKIVKVTEVVPGESKTIHRVVYVNSTGTAQTKEFADASEAAQYVQDLQQRNDTSTMVANLDRPGAF